MVCTSLVEDYTMCGTSNYVAKLRADVLSAENLESLGHILDFATLLSKLLSTTVYWGNPLVRIREGDSAIMIPTPTFLRIVSVTLAR
jgi:hypothetical protein